MKYTELQVAKLMLCSDLTPRKISEMVHKSATAVRYQTHKICWGIDKELYDAGVINKTDEFGLPLKSKPSMTYLKKHFSELVNQASEVNSKGFFNKARPLLTNLVYMYRVSKCGNHIIQLDEIVKREDTLQRCARSIAVMAASGVEAFYTIGRPMAGALRATKQHGTLAAIS